jgi:hypothetical protein
MAEQKATCDVLDMQTGTKSCFGHNRPAIPRICFTQDGQKLTIICNGDTAAPIFGEINGRRVTFRLKTGSNNEGTVTHTGQLDRKGTTIKGTWHLVNRDQPTRDGKFEARRQ